MSFTSCMKKVAGSISPENKLEIMQLARQNRSAGMSAKDASTKAVGQKLTAVARQIKDAEAEAERLQAEVDSAKRSAERVPLHGGQLQTDTPEFNAWFGQSKVVDKDGRPLVVYHGTASDFSVFDKSKRGSVSDTSDSMLAFYFTSSQRRANQAAADARESYDEPSGAVVMPVYLSMQNPMISRAAQGTPNQTAGLLKRALASGHDGVIFDRGEMGGRDYAVFDPEQVKSAIGNDGAFDPNSADITKSTERADFLSDDLNGYFDFGNGVEGDVIAKRGSFAAIYEWTSTNTLKSNTRPVLSALQQFGGGHLMVKDPGDVGSPSYSYWQKMLREGLVNEVVDNEDSDITEQMRASDSITKSAERKVWYSQLQRAIEQTPERLSTMAASQWSQWLKANAGKLGVKADELEWSGIDDYLKLRGKDKISSAELAQWVGENGVQVTEMRLGERHYEDVALWWNDEGGANEETPFIDLTKHEKVVAAERYTEEVGQYADAGDATKYGQYTLPGGTNYREVLLTLPVPIKQSEDSIHADLLRLKELTTLMMRADSESYKPLRSERDLIVARQNEREAAHNAAYKSNHWDQKNVIAHVRLNDRSDADGKRVLFVEEIQSDWAQQGKKSGFNTEGPTTEERAAASASHSTPAAPFVTKTSAWVSLALKRVIKMAVDEGYDKVALVNGEQSAERYDLSKQVNYIQWNPGFSSDPEVMRSIVQLETSDGQMIGFEVDTPAGGEGIIAEGDFAGKTLDEVVGKEVAQKINQDDSGDLRGLDLKVGGEGMKAFYDQIVPNVVRDVLKKLGGDGLRDVPVVIDGAGWQVTPPSRTASGRWMVKSSDYSSKGLQFDTEVEALAALAEKQGSSSQPGFDITDKMREQAADGVPLFSRERDATETAPAVAESDESATSGWQSPSASKFDSMVYTMQDKHVDTARVVAAIKDAGAAIRDDLDVYLQEELFHGRAAKKTEDFVHLELEPLVEKMKAVGVSVADLDQFLHARHAREANAVIAQRNPEIQDGGSGMLNQDAVAYFAETPSEKLDVLRAMADKVDTILAATKKMMVDYQLESADTVRGWGEMFEHYVPLMREDDGVHTGGAGTGQGFSIKGKEVKSRTGSTRKVVDIFANIAMQRERTIVRGEKNRVSQALVGLAQANPNKDFWHVDTVPKSPAFNKETGLVEMRPDPMFKQRDNVLVAKVAHPDGIHEHAVIFSEKDERAMRMAAALKNLDAAQLEGFLGASAKVTRYFAAVNTQYNPVFGVVNLVRDVQDAMINLGSTELAGKQATVARQTMSALRGIYGDLRAERRGELGTSQWAHLWEEFKDVGGQTGYRQLFATSNDRAEAIKKALDPTAWMDSKLGKIFTAGGALKVPLAAAQRGAKWVFDWLSDYNEAMENGVRLSAYKTGLDAGMSKERAASLAKNLTVNFNRKGQAAQQAGALYAFFNASAQGTGRVARTLFTMEPGKPKTIRLSALGQKIVAGGMLLGTLQALAMAAAGFGDDDPPEFARNNNLIIPTGGKKYVTIPLPQGFRILPAMGRITTEWAMGGFKNTTKRGLAMAALFADSFNPIGSAGLSMQTLAPTAFDPLIALTENKDFTGRPIAKTSSNKAIPGHELGRDTSTTIGKLISEGINTLTGGTKHTAGVVSPTPDQVDYLIDQVLGGVGRELSKLEQTGLGTVRGEDVPLYKIPLAGRFVGDAASQASESTNFYANAAHLNEIETEIKGLRKEGKFAEAEKFRSKAPDSYLITVANHAELAVQRLRKEKSALLTAGADREKVKAIEVRITERMASLNRAVEAIKGRAQ